MPTHKITIFQGLQINSFSHEYNSAYSIQIKGNIGNHVFIKGYIKEIKIGGEVGQHCSLETNYSDIKTSVMKPPSKPESSIKVLTMLEKKTSNKVPTPPSKDDKAHKLLASSPSEAGSDFEFIDDFCHIKNTAQDNDEKEGESNEGSFIQSYFS